MLLKLINHILAFINHNINRIVLLSQGVKFGHNLVINGRIYIKNYGTVEIGNNVTINSGQRFSPVGGHAITRIIVQKGAHLSIGDDSGISNSTFFVQSQVNIGLGVMIGGSCNIWDTDFHSMDPSVRGTSNDIGKTFPIFIGNKAFIGAHSILLKGTKVGNGSVIGAGTVGSIQTENNQIFTNRINKDI